MSVHRIKHGSSADRYDTKPHTGFLKIEILRRKDLFSDLYNNIQAVDYFHSMNHIQCSIFRDIKVCMSKLTLLPSCY